MIFSDTTRLRSAEAHLKLWRKSSIPYAVRNGLNDLAFETRERWQREMQETMTLRNKWTTGSVRIERAKGSDVSAMESIVGSLADYMETQEHGGKEVSTGKHGVPIPTPVASGEGMGARPRKRLVRRSNFMNAINLPKSQVHGGRAQRNAIKIKMAMREKNKFAFLETKHGAGLFRITGKKKPSIKMLWDLSNKTVHTPKNSTLMNSATEVLKRGNAIFAARFEEQVERIRRR